MFTTLTHKNAPGTESFSVPRASSGVKLKDLAAAYSASTA